MLRLVVPDLISPSYFPAIAAVELGCIASRGVEVQLSLRFPVTDAVEALRAGEVDVLAGAAHALFHGAENGGGVRLLAALSHHTYWFLVVRTDLGIERGTPLTALKGLRVGAAPGPDQALTQLLVDAGCNPDEVAIGPVPGTAAAGVSFGVTAAEALASGTIDAFWANGMGAAVAVQRGTGTVLVDARRDAKPPGSQWYTFAGLMSTTKLEEQRSEELQAVVAGLIEAQHRLRAESGAAFTVASKVFPPLEAGLTPKLIARDAPFYDPTISPEDVAGLVRFSRARGLISNTILFDELVFGQFQRQWTEKPPYGGRY